VPPAFAPAAGTYAAPQTVALTSATPDAVIYYTTNGTAPTAGSSQYSSPIVVDANETVKAIAISPTLGISNVESAAYVIQNPIPAFSLTATPASGIDQGASTTSTVTITPAGGFTGTVALTCAVTSSPTGAVDAPTCTATQPAAITGTATVSATLTIDTQGTTTPGSYTATVTGAAGSLTSTTNVAMTVIVNSAFALSGAPISIASPGASGTSTITITPSGGFTGTVAITCAITSSPPGAVDPPTCSATQPAAISGGAAVTSTLTVNTTAASTAALHIPLQRILTLGGGGTLAALLFFGLPLRRRKWQMLFSLLAFLAIASAAVGCGGPSVNTKQPSGGTTAGSYTVTVTGTSGSTTAKPIAVTITVE
jgi:hypothetical protein